MTHDPSPPRVTFFTRPECNLCDAAWFVVAKVCAELNAPLERVDISAPGNERWLTLYQHHIPVVHRNGVEIARHRVEERALRRLLEFGFIGGG